MGKIKPNVLNYNHETHALLHLNMPVVSLKLQLAIISIFAVLEL